MRVKLYSYNDGSYNFTVHLPQTSWFIKKSCKIAKGAGAPGHEEVGMVHVKQVNNSNSNGSSSEEQRRTRSQQQRGAARTHRPPAPPCCVADANAGCGSGSGARAPL